MSSLVVTLDESTGSQIGYAPLTLTLNPSGYSVSDGPIVKIEYDFADGRDSTIVKRRLSVDSPEISAYAYPDDPGDPRNILVTHNLFPSVSSDPQVFNVSVKVTKATTFLPVEYIVPISVFKVDAINGLNQGYFGDIHLIGMRVHGLSNIKTLMFETKNPRYVTVTTYNDTVEVLPPYVPTTTPTPTPTPTVTPTPTTTPSVSCEYTLPSMPAHDPAVVDLSELAGFVGGSLPAFSDLYGIGGIMSEDARVVGVSFFTSNYVFTRDGDTTNFTISSVDTGTQDATSFYGIDRNYRIVGDTHSELGG